MPMLSDTEWKAVSAPFYYLRVRPPANWGKTGTVVHDMVDKWIEANTHGWFYRYSTPGEVLFIFADEGDRAITKLWLSTDPFNEEAGSVEAAQQ